MNSSPGHHGAAPGGRKASSLWCRLRRATSQIDLTLNGEGRPVHATVTFGEDMVKQWLMGAVPLFFVVSQALMGQKDLANPGSWSGVIINSDCTPDEAFAESAKCTEDRGPAAKLSLYDDTIRAVYTLDPQDQAVGHLGDSVTVE